MPGRYSYSSPFSHGNDPWFRVGQIDVTTTVAVIGMGIASMFLWAIEGRGHAISEKLWLISSDVPGVDGVLDGQIWRLVTWPIPNEPDFWTIILFAIFYMLGTQIENVLGRRPFMFFLLGLTIIPAVAVTVVELALPDFVGASIGLRLIELGVLVAFAAQYPRAMFWPGIPAFAIAGIILLIDYLQILGDRNEYEFVLLTAVVATSLIGLRSFGHAQDLPWIPAVPLPASVTGSSSGSSSTPRRRRRSRGGRANLRPVPGPAPSDPLADMEIDALLDQVAEKGLDSLTKAQRRRLEEHSKRLRKRRDG